MYLSQPIRYIPDIDEPPVTMVPKITEKLDLCSVMLRAVSPIHLEYLRNMGVASNVSVAIANNDALWGLIVCHYRNPRRIPLSSRFAVMIIQ